MTDLDEFSAGDRPPAEDVDSHSAIGTMSVQEGLQLDEDGQRTRLSAYITPPNRESIRLRSYVVVPLATGADERPAQLFCRVSGLRYAHEFDTDDATAIHAQRALQRDEIDESDYKYIATLTPVATLIGDPTEPDAALTRRQPNRLPKPDASVREAVFDAEIKTGLKLPQEGLFVGHVAVGGEKLRTAASPPTVDYRLRDANVADPLLFRHVLVAGGTGSGKTHAAKNLLRQVVAENRRYEMPDGRTPRPALVIVDPQDEYAQLHDDNPALDGDDTRRFRRERIAHGGVDDTVVFVPDVAGTKYEATNHRAEQVRFSIPFELVRSNTWLIAGGGLNDRQVNGLNTLLSTYFREESDTPTYDRFQTFIAEDPTVHELVEREHIHEKTYNALKRRIDRAYFSQVFDQPASDITDLTDRLVREGGISTIPTYHLENAAQRNLVVLAVATMLIENKLTSDPRFEQIAETPLVLAMDEAHNYLADADTVQAEKTIDIFTEAAKQGRKERLGLFLVTQDPGDIADPIFKQVNTRLALNLADEDAIASLNLPAQLSKQISDLETGQLIAHSPDNAESVQVIGLEHCVVKHDPR